MQNKNLENVAKVLILCAMALFLSACVKNSEYSKRNTEPADLDVKPFEKRLLEEEKIAEKKQQATKAEAIEQLDEEKNAEQNQPIKTQEKASKKKDKKFSAKDKQSELDFLVQNIAGKTIYVTCFSYIKKRLFTRWRWDKSDIYKIEPGQTVTVDIDTIPDEQERKNVYGYLAVFNNEQEANDSIYELLDDKVKVDLDLLYKLKNEVVKIGIEKYGIKGKLLDYAFEPINKKRATPPELDFFVENKTGKTLYLACFVYQLKEDLPVWRYDKTDVIKLMPNETKIIDVDTIAGKYERVYVRGYLAVFDENEKEKADQATYELLAPKNKISLERLAALKNKKVVLEIEKYGVEGDIIDYEVKPVRRIDFQKAFKRK
jgi:hypothetical protein